MKKIFLAICALCLFPLFAELYPARRYVELGVGVDVIAAQNIMPFSDIFKKHLVIDLKKIYNDMSRDGATVALSEKEDVHLDFNFKKFGLGLFAGAEFNANMNISKDLFKVLDCVTPGTVYEAEANFWAESFATFSLPVRFNVNKWKIKITPTYFVPAFYVPSTTVRGTAVNREDGSIDVKASASLVFYTISEIKGLVKDGELSSDFDKNIDASVLLSDIATAGGLDLSAAVEYAFSDKLDLGGYVTAPILPGHLRHKVTANATLSVHTDSLMDMMFDGKSPDTESKFGDASYSDCDYIVNRPLRFGVECAWRPFGKWFTLRGLVGGALRNPFGEDVSIKSLYPEYKLGVEVVGIGMFGLSLSTRYEKKVFAHGMDIMLNFRAVEFDISAAVCSPSFVQSFKGEGAAVGFGFKLGW